MGSGLSKSFEVDVASPVTKKTSADKPKEMERFNFDKWGTTAKEIQDGLRDTRSNETEEDGTGSDISSQEGNDTAGKEESENVPFLQQIKELEEAKLEEVRNRIYEVHNVVNYDYIKEGGNFPEMTAWLTHLVSISCVTFKGASLDRVTLFIKTVANILIETKAIALICEIYKYYGWKVGGGGEKNTVKTELKPLFDSALILGNFSDASDEFATYIANYPGLLDAIRYVMVEKTEAHLKRGQMVCFQNKAYKPFSRLSVLLGPHAQE